MSDAPRFTPDVDLMPRLRAGEKDAFETMVREYTPTVRLVASQRINNASDVEEIIQDTFVRVHRSIATFRGESSFKTWIVRIAMNLAYNRYHYNWRRRAGLTDSLNAPLNGAEELTLGDLLTDSDSDHRDGIELVEFESNLSLALSMMSQQRRELIHMLTVRHLQYEDIAAELGINLGTVKSRIARARSELREKLNAIAQPERAEGAA